MQIKINLLSTGNYEKCCFLPIRAKPGKICSWFAFWSGGRNQKMSLTLRKKVPRLAERKLMHAGFLHTRAEPHGTDHYRPPHYCSYIQESYWGWCSMPENMLNSLDGKEFSQALFHAQSAIGLSLTWLQNTCLVRWRIPGPGEVTSTAENTSLLWGWWEVPPERMCFLLHPTILTMVCHIWIQYIHGQSAVCVEYHMEQRYLQCSKAYNYA